VRAPDPGITGHAGDAAAGEREGPRRRHAARFYQSGHALRGFEAGIQYALARILVDPQFIYRFEREPAGLRAGAAYRVSDLELASRLSFFLWSSIPDEELLGLAAKGRCPTPPC
jgi:hypothetical protein